MNNGLLTLEMPIQQFKRMLRDRKTATNKPANAFNICRDISHAFMWFCAGMGIRNARLICVKAPAKELTVPGRKSDALLNHYIVRVGKFYIDWTARQFWDDAPYPMIMDRSELKKIWRHIDG